MVRVVKRHAPAIAIALAVSFALSEGPEALARAVAYARRAGKVDGKDAVGAGATIAGRAGKLVATGATGRLPNDIIWKARRAGRADRAGRARRAGNASRLAGLALAQVSPLLSSETDASPASGYDAAGVARVETNRITLPSAVAGFLVISGSVEVAGAGDEATTYHLIPKLGGSPLYGQGAYAAETVTPNHVTTLAYTVTAPVGAGTHVISQDLGPAAGTASFSYRRNNLTALFVPSTRAKLRFAP